MNGMKRLLPAVLAGTLVLGLSPAALGAEKPTEKEEVVYINLDAAGAAASVDVVNIFDLARAGHITDHGAYESVRNMTTTDELRFDGETVSAEAGPGRLYYEGRLPAAEIPWRFTLRYFLDGEERTAEDIAGASGALEIRMTVRENPRCQGDFFDSYALQASFTLDGDKCADIQTEGATIANVGSDKQLTYTILPGRGADISITAQVRDFTMDQVAVNGVPLSLDVEVDDAALLGKVTELTDAIQALDEGAGELSGGVEELQAGADALNAGTGSVSSGAAQLQSGAAALQSGAAQFQTALNTLAGQSAALTGGSQTIKDGLAQLQQAVAGASITPEQIAQLQQGASDMIAVLDQMKAGVEALQAGLAAIDMSQLPTLIAGNQAAIAGLTPYVAFMSQVQDVINVLEKDNEVLGSLAALSDGLAQLSGGMTQLQDGFTAFSAGVEQLAGAMGSLPDNVQALKEAVDALAVGYGDLDAGIAAYTNGVAQLNGSFYSITNGASSLSAGAGTLAEGAAALSGGAAELAQGVGELDTGAAELAEGTTAMREQTDGMDEQIGEQIDALLSDVTGGGGETVSFVSPENTNVKAVQFVIRTPAIQKAAQPAPEPEPQAETSFWEKLTALF